MRDVRRRMDAEIGEVEKPILPYLPEPDRTGEAENDPKIS